MNTTCIIPRSTIEERYDRAREDFNDQYDNSPYKLKCKEFYLGGGVENYEVSNKILSMNEKEIPNPTLKIVIRKTGKACVDTGKTSCAMPRTYTKRLSIW